MTKERLSLLLEFVRALPEEQVRIAFSSPDDEPRNTLIVGDWFFAESHARHDRLGWLRTVLTRHALSVLDRIEEFDEDFAKLPSYAGRDAVNELRRLIDERDDPQAGAS